MTIQRSLVGSRANDATQLQLTPQQLEQARQKELRLLFQQQRAKLEEENRKIWNGPRVRIGVHCGMGDIRKDPVSQGYDYYGPTVNTAARVEGVGHGGQTLITDDVVRQMRPTLVKDLDAVMIDLGHQPLKGLEAPIRLYQLVPSALQGRIFPPLRLHIEKDTEDDSDFSTTNGTTGNATTATGGNAAPTITSTGKNAQSPPQGVGDSGNFTTQQQSVAGGGANGSSNNNKSGNNNSAANNNTTTHNSPLTEAKQLIARLCGSKAYATVTPEHLLDRHSFFITMLAPAADKLRVTILIRLAEFWGNGNGY